MYVEIKDITFKYDNSKENILEKFSMNMEKGEIVAILGNSGSGKSTILRIISGLEEHCLGSIKIGERVILDNNTFVEAEKRGVGMVFQDYALFPHMTVEENVKYGLKKIPKKDREVICEEMLTLVQLKDFRKRYPYELSGGQQQRVAIARALAPKPNILLLDEPFSNLDHTLQGKLRDEIKEILKSANITSIFVTHNIEDANVLADKIIRIKVK